MSILTQGKPISHSGPLFFLGVILILGSIGWVVANKDSGSQGFELGIAFAPGIIGVLILIVIYDNQPLPDASKYAPVLPHLTTDERWRKTTSLRFLERLKAEVVGLEDGIRTQHAAALDDYKGLLCCVGRIRFNLIRNKLTDTRMYLDMYSGRVSELKERIERVFSGDVAIEVQNLEEAIQKQERNKQELQSSLAEVEGRLHTNGPCNCEKCEEHKKNHSDLRVKLHALDLDTIGFKSDLKELREFDFKRMYRELGLPGHPGVFNVDKENIRRAKENIEIMNDIPPFKSREPKPSDEDIRLKNKAKWEKKVQELKYEKMQKMGGAETTEERVRYANFFDEEIVQAEEQWRKYL